MDRFKLRQFNLEILIARYGSRAELVKALGVAKSEINNYFGDNARAITDKKVIEYETKLNLDSGFFDKEHHLREVKHKMLPVPLMEFKVCANDGIEAWGERVIDDMLIPERIVHKKQLNLNNIICTEVSGDCMHPTYNDGDYVFIDRSHCDGKYVINNSVYVVKYNYELSIKRLEKFPNYMLMKSDNPNKILFRDREVLFSDVDEGKINFEIVGLVVYSMGD